MLRWNRAFSPSLPGFSHTELICARRNESSEGSWNSWRLEKKSSSDQENWPEEVLLLGGWRREAELGLGGEEEVCIVFIKINNFETCKKKAKHKGKHEKSKI